MIKEAMLYKSMDGSLVECGLCAHHCRIAESQFGFCKVRQNKEGKLYTHVYGEVIAAHVDPIEKKPLYHFLPGSMSYSIAAPGCNFRCGFCQNWQISQLSAQDQASKVMYKMSSEQIVKAAIENNCKSISYTYTEPTIFFEYAFDTAKIAKQKGLSNIFVTNGFMTAETLQMIKPYLDAANVDLKFFREETYKKICKGRLQPVLDSIKLMKKSGIWLEITTLVVPGLNDSEEELADIAAFIAGVDKKIPWHISRFFPNFEYYNVGATPLDILKKAKEIGKEKGLQHVYLGNV
ncbi:MAG: AmmeMemoRadiSam system radical SAM enzyme [Candidatus Omnitrophota bacterium]